MKNPKEFWQEKHKRQHALWLTGSYLGKLCQIHSVYAPKDKVVLEVGVGLGRATRELAVDNEVYAVDISQVALDNLGNDVEKKFLSADMCDIPDNTVDWAICHLVFQHCVNDAIEFILKQTIRILKPGGLFILQSGDSKKPVGANVARTAKRELIWHSPDEIKQAITDAGGEVLREQLSQRTVDIYWQLLHVTKSSQNI